MKNTFKPTVQKKTASSFLENLKKKYTLQEGVSTATETPTSPVEPPTEPDPGSATSSTSVSGSSSFLENLKKKYTLQEQPTKPTVGLPPVAVAPTVTQPISTPIRPSITSPVGTPGLMTAGRVTPFEVYTYLAQYEAPKMGALPLSKVLPKIEFLPEEGSAVFKSSPTRPKSKDDSEELLLSASDIKVGKGLISNLSSLFESLDTNLPAGQQIAGIRELLEAIKNYLNNLIENKKYLILTKDVKRIINLCNILLQTYSIAVSKNIEDYKLKHRNRELLNFSLSKIIKYSKAKDADKINLICRLLESVVNLKKNTINVDNFVDPTTTTEVSIEMTPHEKYLSDYLIFRGTPAVNIAKQLISQNNNLADLFIFRSWKSKSEVDEVLYPKPSALGQKIREMKKKQEDIIRSRTRSTQELNQREKEIEAEIEAELEKEPNN